MSILHPPTVGTNLFTGNIMSECWLSVTFHSRIQQLQIGLLSEKLSRELSAIAIVSDSAITRYDSPIVLST